MQKRKLTYRSVCPSSQALIEPHKLLSEAIYPIDLK